MKVVSQEKQSSRKRKIPKLHPRRPSKTEDAGLLGGVRTEHLRINDIMVVLNSGKRYGVVSMDHQVETVPGPKPRRGPPPATGTSDPKHLAGKGQSKATGYNLRLCHWNAEGRNLRLIVFSNPKTSKCAAFKKLISIQTTASLSEDMRHSEETGTAGQKEDYSFW